MTEPFRPMNVLLGKLESAQAERRACKNKFDEAYVALRSAEEAEGTATRAVQARVKEGVSTGDDLRNFLLMHGHASTFAQCEELCREILKNMKGHSGEPVLVAETVTEKNPLRGPDVKYSHLVESSVYRGDATIQAVHLSMGCFYAEEFLYDNARQELQLPTKFYVRIEGLPGATEMKEFRRPIPFDPMKLAGVMSEPDLATFMRSDNVERAYSVFVGYLPIKNWFEKFRRGNFKHLLGQIISKLPTASLG